MHMDACREVTCLPPVVLSCRALVSGQKGHVFAPPECSLYDRIALASARSRLYSDVEADARTDLSRSQRSRLKPRGGPRTLGESLRRCNALSYGMHTAAALQSSRCQTNDLVRAAFLESTQSDREEQDAAATTDAAVAAAAAAATAATTGIRKPAACCKFPLTQPRGQLHVRGWRGARLLSPPPHHHHPSHPPSPRGTQPSLIIMP